MIEKPNKDTELRVQQLFVGSYQETDMWSQDLAGVELFVSCQITHFKYDD